MFDEGPMAAGVFDFEELANLLVEQGSAASPARIHGALSGLLAAGEALLVEQGSAASPARIHGALSGLLAAGAQPLAELGLDAVSQLLDLVAHGELAEQILSLYTVTAGSLADEDFEFHPLLPEDDEALDVRIEALGDWSAGFLLGFNWQHGRTPAQAETLSADSSEILSDLAALAEVAPADDEDEDESEAHYAELVEYLRFAVLNVFMDTRIALTEAQDGSGLVH